MRPRIDTVGGKWNTELLPWRFIWGDFVCMIEREVVRVREWTWALDSCGDSRNKCTFFGQRIEVSVSVYMAQ